jgi:hypothetical protein
MGQYQNPRYTGTNDPTAFTNAFNTSFSMWYDKIFGSLMAGQNQRAKKAAATAQAKKDYDKIYGEIPDNLKDSVDGVDKMSGTMRDLVNVFMLRVEDVSRNAGIDARQMRKNEHQFQEFVTPWSHLAAGMYGKNAIDFNKLNYGHGDGFDKLKLLVDDVGNATKDQTAKMMGFDIAVPGQVLSDDLLEKGVKVGDIFAHDIELSDGTTLSHSELQTILHAANDPTNQLDYVMDVIDSKMETNITATNNNTRLNINEAYKVTPDAPYEGKMDERNSHWRNGVTNTVDGLNSDQLKTIWRNKMVTSNIFQEGDMDPNGNPMSAELAERLNSLNFGDVQEALHNFEKSPPLLPKVNIPSAIKDDTWEGIEASGMGVTQELSVEDYDLASFVIEAQKSKIADYLVENKDYATKLDVVKRAKPLTVREASLGEIKTENGRQLYKSYETDLSDLMAVYTHKDRYTTDNVTLTNTGTSLRDFLMGRAIKVGGEKYTILGIKLDDGVLSVKVPMSKKAGEIKTSPDQLFKYNLKLSNYNDFYKLIGNLTSALNPDDIINENTRYDRISRNPY